MTNIFLLLISCHDVYDPVTLIYLHAFQNIELHYPYTKLLRHKRFNAQMLATLGYEKRGCCEGSAWLSLYYAV